MSTGTAFMLVVHSAARHSGKTTICRSLICDLPFDVYVKLSHHSPCLIQRTASSGTLPRGEGDTGRLGSLRRSPGLQPLADVIFLDGPRRETDQAVLHTVHSAPCGTRFLIEGNCAAAADCPTRYAYVLPCPLPENIKSDVEAMARRADILIINRFPGCEAAREQALTAILHDVNPRAALLCGSTEDRLFIDTVEAAVVPLLPAADHPCKETP